MVKAKLISTFSIALSLGGMRGLVLLSKFILVTFVAARLESDSFGLFVFLTSVITYGIFIAGFEFYAISFRSYLNSNLNINDTVLGSHIVYSTRVCSLATVLAIIYFFWSDFVINIYLLAGLIGLFEYITDEFGRLAIYRNEQIYSNVIRFIKTTCWIVPFIVFYWDISEISLLIIMHSWLLGTIGSFIFCILVYHRLFDEFNSPNWLGVNFKAWPALIKSITPFLLVSFCYRTPVILDKVVINYYGSLELVGWYGYYYNFAYGLQALFDVMIMAWFVPRSIALKNDKKALYKLTNSYILMTLMFFLVLGVAAIFLVSLVTKFMAVSFVNDGLTLLIVAIAGQCLFAMSGIYGLSLYAKKADLSILTGSGLYLFMFIFSAVPLTVVLGAIGVAWAIFLASLILLVVRLFQVKSLLK